MESKEEFRLPKQILHEINVKRRIEEGKIVGSSYQVLKIAGMDKVMSILGYDWKDNRYQRIAE